MVRLTAAGMLIGGAGLWPRVVRPSFAQLLQACWWVLQAPGMTECDAWWHTTLMGVLVGEEGP